MVTSIVRKSFQAVAHQAIVGATAGSGYSGSVLKSEVRHIKVVERATGETVGMEAGLITIRVESTAELGNPLIGSQAMEVTVLSTPMTDKELLRFRIQEAVTRAMIAMGKVRVVNGDWT